MSNSIAPGSSADVNVRVTALTTNPNVPVTYKTIILKKNLVNGVNTLTQEMMSNENIKHVIKYDYVLGEDITIPANCLLEFDGGSISNAAGNNYVLTGNDTILIYTQDIDTVVNNVVMSGTFKYTPIGVENVTDIAKPFIINYETTPQQFGAIGDGTSHLLSSIYDTLAEAQEKYPFVDSLNWEIDTCAIQSALNKVYDNDGGDLYIPEGKYMINKELYCKSFSPHINGAQQGEYTFGTILYWNGDAGTIDNQKYILKIETQKPDGTYDSDLKIKQRLRDLQLSNIKFDSSSSISNQITNYVSAVYIGPSSQFKIFYCSFGNVYDGIVCNTVLLSDFHHNNFYGVYRDGISIRRTKIEFSTTFRICYNEFGYVGRYAVYANSAGGSSSTPQISDNDFECGNSGGYYFNHPEGFVQGIRSVVCLIGQSMGYFDKNRFEATSVEYSVHFVNTNNIHLGNNIFDKGILIACTTTSLNTNIVTQDYIDYYNQNGYEDITIDRNILLTLDGNPDTTTGYSLFDNIYFGSGQFITTCKGWSSSRTTLPTITDKSFIFGGSWMHSTNIIRCVPIVNNQLDYENENVTIGIKEYYHSGLTIIINDETRIRGLIKIINPELLFGTIQFRTTKYETEAPTDEYDGWQINRLLGNPSSGAEVNIVDHPFIFCNDNHNSVNKYYEVDVVKKRKIRYEYSAAPNSGTWNRGDMVYNKNPSAGGYMGWVCVTAGTPGTWKGFGLIEA